MINEQEILSRLAQAIQQEIGICELDAFIESPSLINTCRERDRLLIKRVEFGPDPDHPDQYSSPPMALDVAYWKGRPDKFARIIGICWEQKNKPVIFRAIVYPP